METGEEMSEKKVEVEKYSGVNVQVKYGNFQLLRDGECIYFDILDIKECVGGWGGGSGTGDFFSIQFK